MEPRLVVGARSDANRRDMDFSRGSRRARHVAANGNGNGNASPGQGRLQVPAAVATSRTPPAVTPENQMGDGRHQRSPVDAAPPPHPFRLHQSKFSSTCPFCFFFSRAVLQSTVNKWKWKREEKRRRRRQDKKKKKRERDRPEL